MNDGVLLAALSAGIGLAALILLRARIEQSRLVAGIGALVLIGAAAGITILTSRELPPFGAQVSERVELLLTMAAGPAALLTVARLLRAPLNAWLPVGLGASGFFLLLIMDIEWGGDPIIYAIPLQALFTLWAWVLMLRHRDVRLGRRSRAWRLRRIALVLLVAVSAVNAASLTRLAFPDVDAMRSIVPWTLATMFFVASAGLVWLALARHAPAFRDAGGEDDPAVARLVALIAGEQLFRDRGFGIEDAAARLGEPAAALNAALARSEYGGFAFLLQSLRLDRAERLLADPAESATSIDAIGMLCGFGSRSTFYEAFQQRFGMAPGLYRKRAQNLSGD